MPSETPSANPSRSCEEADCGWGILNPWTCRCDCAVGYCLDENNQCYLTCAETINNNPFGGCSPGWDCPWFPDPAAGHCRSEMHPTQQFDIYRTSGQCCDAHFAGSSTCVQESKDSHPPFAWPAHFPGTPEYRQYSPPEQINRGVMWYPDLHNMLNCVRGKRYEVWMSDEGFAEHYLFSDANGCCSYWYPGKVDCPYMEEASTVEEDHAPWYADPYPTRGYYYPDFSVSSCGFGRDFPSWMGSDGYEKFYLFTEGKRCCDKYFSSSKNCPYEDETTDPQTGYYWEKYQEDLPNAVAAPVIYNHTFYPDMKARTCVNGTNYPDWMVSDKEFIRLYLFKNNPEGCCTFWFGESSVNSCVKSIIQSTYIDSNDAQASGVTPVDKTKMWYPNMHQRKCENDASMPLWMLEEDYAEWYLHHSKQHCNAAFGFS